MLDLEDYTIFIETSSYFLLLETALREVGGYFRSGKLKNKETIVTGLDQAVGAFIGLFEGKNVGKMVVKLE